MIFRFYSQSGFGYDWISQVNLQVLLDLGTVRPGMGCRSDRRVMRGQTGAARGLTGRHCVGFGFGLFIWISEFFFMIMTSKWMLYVCNTIVCC